MGEIIESINSYPDRPLLYTSNGGSLRGLWEISDPVTNDK